MTRPVVFVKIPDHTLGVVPGQSMPLRVHIHDVQPQSAWAIAKFIDPAGRGCGSVRDTFEITADRHVLDLVWRPVFDGGPGIYWVEVLLELYSTDQRIVISRPFQVVYPGRPVPGAIYPVERDGPIRSLSEFPAPDVDVLRAAWHAADAAVRKDSAEDGSFGGGVNSYNPYAEPVPGANHPLVRDCGAAVMAYLLSWRLWGDEQHAKLARDGLDYLMRDQHESGAFIYWGIPEGELNDTDNFYTTGYGGLALILGHEILEHPGTLDAARRAADWMFDRPFTGNVNYDLFAGWFLPQLARLTGETRYLDYMIGRTEEAAFEGQNAGGAWPRHNFALGYHSIILLGMATLYQELPGDHPFKPRLHTRLVMAANFMASLIAPDGHCFLAWERHQEEFFIDWRGRPGGLKVPATGVAVFAWRITSQCLEVDDGIQAGLCHAFCEDFKNSPEAKPIDDRNMHSPIQRLLAITNLLLWLAEREAPKPR